jgi:hypothetical protein
MLRVYSAGVVPIPSNMNTQNAKVRNIIFAKVSLPLFRIPRLLSVDEVRHRIWAFLRTPIGCSGSRLLCPGRAAAWLHGSQLGGIHFSEASSQDCVGNWPSFTEQML